MEEDNTASLFLGDLPFVCTEADVRRAFEPYGLLLGIRIKRGKSKKHLSYGFIDFSCVDEAVNAMHALDNTKFLGKDLKVRWASKKQGLKLKSSSNSTEGTTDVSLPSVTTQSSDYSIVVNLKFRVINSLTITINQNYFAEMMNRFGHVSNISIVDCNYNNFGCLSEGQVRVSYDKSDQGFNAAMSSVRIINNSVQNGIYFTCEIEPISRSNSTYTSPRNAIAPGHSMSMIHPNLYQQNVQPVMNNQLSQPAHVAAPSFPGNSNVDTRQFNALQATPYQQQSYMQYQTQHQYQHNRIMQYSNVSPPIIGGSNSMTNIHRQQFYANNTIGMNIPNFNYSNFHH